MLRIILMALMFISLQAHAVQRNLAVTASNAQAQKRVALVIGNAAYKSAPALRNPVNDAKAMSNALNGLGFEVIEVTDATQKEMFRAVTAFGSKLNSETAALFFYAGHGMQVRGKNYIIPVDAQIETEAAVASESVSVDTVLEQLNVSTISIVILDACRNNPFERSFRKMGSGGLAQMDAPKGSFIAYATAPGKTAADGDGKNGLFTQELLKQIKESGLTLETVFKRVRANVAARSGDAQMPWDSSSMTGEFYFKPGTGTQVASLNPIATSVQPSAQVKSTDEIEDDTWKVAEGINALDAYEAYLSGYPSGRYAVQAKMKLAALKKPNQIATLTSPPDAAKPNKTIGEPEMVRIPGKNYEIGKFEVTQGEWRSVMGNNPSKHANCGDTCPVENVSLNDANEFIEKLNIKTGKQYRLPTEAEWEYACYGGSKSEYCGGGNVDSVAWYDGNSGYISHPAGQKQANGYGLYDMSGNVWEWTQDDCHGSLCGKHELRGGSYFNGSQFVRAVKPFNFVRYGGYGCRLARSLPQ